MKIKTVSSKGALRILTIIILTGLLTTQFLSAQDWYNSNWRYRSPVTVTNPGATILTNFQVKITLNTSNFDFAKALNDGSDIRLAASNGTTLISFWIESWSSTTAIIWAKVPTVPASGTATVYLYYGNTSAASAASGPNTFEFYDDFESWIQTSTAWSEKLILPTPQADLTCAVYDGKLYAIGGYNNTASDPLSENYEYDPILNTWQTKAPMPTRRWGPIGVEFNGKIYVFGGQLLSGAGSNANEIYDPTTDAWTSRLRGNPLSIPDYDATGVVHPDVIYFPSGKDGYEYWMAYTPYPPQSEENPSILRSHDGITWTDNGITNPVIPEGADGAWNDLENPDPDFLYVSDIDKWFMVWDGGDAATNSRKIALAYSSDGKTWTQYNGNQVNGNTNPIILSGTDTYGAAWERSSSGYSKTCTPTLYYNSGTFYLFYAEEASGNNRGKIGLANFTWNNAINSVENLVRNIGNPIINLPDDAIFKSGGGHIDISKNTNSNLFHMYIARELSGSSNIELGLLTSSDLLSWTNQGKAIERGVTGQWDETHIYRSCPVVNSSGEIVFFDNNIRMYYSAYSGSSVGIGIADITPTGSVIKFEGEGPQSIPSTIAKQGLMGVRYNDKIHLFYLSYHYEYDPATDTYTQKADVPNPRTWSTCAVVGSKIYLIGGYSYVPPVTDATSDNQEYDPATDTWATKAPMPVRRYGATRENPVIDGKIYVTHGHAGSPFFITNYVYDPVTDTWLQRSSAVYDRDGVGCGVINNKLYVVGGRRDLIGPYGTSYNEVYDPFVDTWNLQPGPNQWTTSGASYVFADGSAKYQGNYGLVIQQTSDVGTQRYAQSVSGFGSVYALDFDWKVTDIGGYSYIVGGNIKPQGLITLSEGTQPPLFYYNFSGTPSVRWYSGGFTTLTNTSAWNSWHKTTVVRNGTSSSVVFDGTTYQPLTVASGGTGKIQFGVYFATTQYIDNVRVRQWAGSDPVTVVGSEQARSSSWIGLGADTGWNTIGNWDNGIPTSLTMVTIPAGATTMPHVTTQNAICNDLTINSTANLTIESGGGLTVNGNLITTGGTLTINSLSTTSSGSLKIYGTTTGNVTYNRFLRPEANAGDYHFFSSPVGGQTVLGFTSSNSSKINLIGSNYQIWEWKESDGTWPLITSAASFVSGKGYNIDQAAGSDGLLTFTGSVVNSTTFTATSPYLNGYSDRSSASAYHETALWAPDRSWTAYGGGGWNLMGNPFTSAMNAGLFISTNNGKFDPHYQALYIFDGINNVYEYAAASVPGYPHSGSFGNNVQAGQGFFVLALYDGIVFNFNSTMQVHNDVVLLKSAETEESWPGLQLKVKLGDIESFTTIVYNDNMTAGLDPGYDVGQLSANPDVEIYTALVAMDNSVNSVRQALPITGADKIIVPVGIDSEKGGEVTFSAYTVPLGNYKFWLEDRTTGIFTDLNTNTYTVTLPAKTYGTGRFFIIASANTPTGIRQPQAEDAGVRIWTSNEKVVIKGDVSEKAKCEIYDVNGQKIIDIRLNGGELNIITIPSGAKGVFIVRVVDGVKVTTRKVALL